MAPNGAHGGHAEERTNERRGGAASDGPVPALFRSDRTGRRRSVLFALGLATAAVSAAAAASAATSPVGGPAATALTGAFAVAGAGFAVAAAAGALDRLVADDQLLWRLGE